MVREQPKAIDRLFLFSLLSLVLFLFIVIKLLNTQVVKGEYYKNLASSQQLESKDILSPRGKLYIHDFWKGSEKRSLIADTVERYQLWVVPRNVKDKADTAKQLAALISLPEAEMYTKINNNKSYIPPLVTGLSREVADRIRQADISGVLLIAELNRYYPEKELAAALIGFVDREGSGQYGIEGFYDDTLRGTAGKLVYERDILGRRIGTEREVAARPGTSYLLTLDRNVQFFLERTLTEAINAYAADGGSIVVLDSKTGGILGAASQPSFDPNQYNELPQTEHHRFVTPLTAGAWEPGSIFKPLIVAAGLDSEKITPEYKGIYNDVITVQGFDIHRSVNRGPQEEDVAKILEFSDNIGMVDIANKVGNDLLFDYIEKFGFGKKVGIDIRGEVPGDVPALRSWREVNRATISFGQGLTVTPLQMVAAYGALANSGRLIRPHIVDQIISPDCQKNGKKGEVKTGCEVSVKPTEVRQVITPKTSEQMKLLLEHVIQHAYSRRAVVEGYRVGGKSGTAQVATPGGGYSSDETIQSFIGIGPLPDAPLVTLVRLNHPKKSKFAESSAAPTFSTVMRFLFQYYQLPPS